MVSVTVWGLAITAFGVSGDRLALALVCLAVAGGADVVSAVFRATMQQLIVPDTFRGRMAAFNIFVVAGGPKLGDVEGGRRRERVHANDLGRLGRVAVSRGRRRDRVDRAEVRALAYR